MLKLHVMCFADSFNIEVSPNLYLKTHVAEQKKDCEKLRALKKSLYRLSP